MTIYFFMIHDSNALFDEIIWIVIYLVCNAQVLDIRNHSFHMISFIPPMEPYGTYEIHAVLTQVAGNIISGIESGQSNPFE